MLGLVDGWMPASRCIGRQRDGWLAGECWWAGKWIEVQMDGWMDGRTRGNSLFLTTSKGLLEL